MRRFECLFLNLIRTARLNCFHFSPAKICIDYICFLLVFLSFKCFHRIVESREQWEEGEMFEMKIIKRKLEYSLKVKGSEPIEKGLLVYIRKLKKERN